jgi:hypothetical protein
VTCCSPSRPLKHVPIALVSATARVALSLVFRTPDCGFPDNFTCVDSASDFNLDCVPDIPSRLLPSCEHTTTTSPSSPLTSHTHCSISSVRLYCKHDTNLKRTHSHKKQYPALEYRQEIQQSLRRHSAYTAPHSIVRHQTNLGHQQTATTKHDTPLPAYTTTYTA